MQQACILPATPAVVHGTICLCAYHTTLRLAEGLTLYIANQRDTELDSLQFVGMGEGRRHARGGGGGGAGQKGGGPPKCEF